MLEDVVGRNAASPRRDRALAIQPVTAEDPGDGLQSAGSQLREVARLQPPEIRFLLRLAANDREGHGYQGRIEANDPLIDASAKMPDGTECQGVEGLQAQLLKREDLFLTALASQLTTYALGRELGFSDRPAVRSSVETMKRNKYMLRSLLLTIVQSESFTTK